MDLGLTLALSLDATQAQMDMGKFGESVTRTFGEAAKATKPLNDSLLSNRESVRLLSEELGVHMPRAVSGAISEMIPNIGDLGTALLGAFAIESVVKFGEMVAKDTEKLYGVVDAEKALAEARKENLKVLEEQAKVSEKYANQQLALAVAGASYQERYVAQLHDWQDERVKWLGWFGEQAMKLSGATEKIQGEEKKLAQVQQLRNDLVKILHDNEVKEHEDAVKAALKHEAVLVRVGEL
jgi:hypothetical protein